MGQDNLDIIFIVIVLVSVIPIGIEVLRGIIAKRQAEKYGSDIVEEFIEEHEPEEERKSPLAREQTVTHLYNARAPRAGFEKHGVVALGI